MLVVMQPWTPTPFAGAVKVVPRNQVDLIPVCVAEVWVKWAVNGLIISFLHMAGNRATHHHGTLVLHNRSHEAVPLVINAGISHGNQCKRRRIKVQG